jgi:hypothetical protein
MHKFVEEFADRIRRLQIEDPGGNYHFPGKAIDLNRPVSWQSISSRGSSCDAFMAVPKMCARQKFQVTRTGKLGIDEIGDVWPISVQI